MRTPRLVLVASLAALVIATGAASHPVQLPLAPVSASGRTVTPVFEGWYENPDGSFSISFGYFNRNSEEIIEIPHGPDNFIEPAELDGSQPTVFHPRRHWGVFALRVPPDFGRGRIVWTLKIRGETFSIPGNLNTDWQIDALAGEAGAGNTPPVLRLAEGGPEGAGPAGVHAEPLAASVATPVELRVWARDDGRPSGSVVNAGREAVPVRLTWFRHAGPHDVTFSEATAEVDVAGGTASTAATFAQPGTYVIRVRANDASGVAGAGHAQCCWTNGFWTIEVSS